MQPDHPNVLKFIAILEAAMHRPLNLDEHAQVMDFLKFPPTDEQLTAVAAALALGNLVISAGAGSGKTSTLRLIGFALDLCFGLKGVYIAYNKSIATEAARVFPANVECRTAHSFAYRAIGFKYKNKLNSGRMTGRQMAQVMDIDRSYSLGTGGKELSTARLASLVMATINNWCHSADELITTKHSSAVLEDVPGAEEVSHDLAVYLAEHATKVWNDDLKWATTGRLPFSHDMYLKVWALNNPVLPGDFILYDEAQDADPCVAGVVLAQSAQLIAVGDECQAIYGWRGAVDAMKNWPAATRVSLTKSFRFGQPVADVANRFLAELNAPLRIEGFEKLSTTVGPIDLAEADAVLCRTNAGVIKAALSIHYARKVAIVGGSEPIRKFAEAAASLMDGRRAAWHADLGAFANWADVLDYVNNDAGGSDLRSMVNIIEAFGVETIYEVCDKAYAGKNPPEGTLILSTVHKAKGGEWGKVVIADDFIKPIDPDTGEPRTATRADNMLRYVAVTRAKTALDCSALVTA